MTEIPLSPSAVELLEWVERETGKPLTINVTSNIGANMLAQIIPHPDRIEIELSPRLLQMKEAIDNSVCHEAIHGYLTHKCGYFFPEPIGQLTIEENMLASMGVTMIEDIVVNKILADSGLQPFAPQYIPMVRREIKAMNEGADVYQEHLSIGNTFYDKFKTYRYVMAWGFLRYFSLSSDDSKIVSRFTKQFERHFRKNTEEAKKITNMIMERDIFLAEGHRIVLNEVYRLWGLEGKIRLLTYV